MLGVRAKRMIVARKMVFSIDLNPVLAFMIITSRSGLIP
jgi:hypothetical protein